MHVLLLSRLDIALEAVGQNTNRIQEGRNLAELLELTFVNTLKFPNEGAWIQVGVPVNFDSIGFYKIDA